ncbi:MAG: hypothetical protein HRT37_16490 [Alteromonadaceae bacterium]|nr:hypothetical protein [Alteromonadaceae bacterium]
MIDTWSVHNKFPKTTTGIAGAKNIGITKMRDKCPQFNAWIAQLAVIFQEVNETEN